MTYQQTDEGEIQRLYEKANRQAVRIEQLEAENARLKSQTDLLKMNAEAARARDKIGRRGLHPKVSAQIQESDE